MIELRLRGHIPPQELEAKKGKILTELDYNVLLTRAAKVLKPNGSLLCVYLPNCIPESLRAAHYPILTTIRLKTENRGMAGGAPRIRTSKEQTRGKPVYSGIIGSMDRNSRRHPLCRLTAWTGQHVAQFESLYPYFQYVAEQFKAHVPQRYAVQQQWADATHPAWIIPGTPFTTITVNNTYPTGVHLDAGDLQEGFSCMSVLRRGTYRGGVFVFAEYRVGIDFQDGDLILMDAHEWHGNTDLELLSPDAERISCVFYYRTAMRECGSPEEEIARANQKETGYVLS